jgi:AraC-like DNA-binding protein
VQRNSADYRREKHSTLSPHRAAMHAIHLIRPAPPLREYVRYYARREVRLYDAVVTHPAPARAAPLLEFNFGDPLRVLNLEPFREFVSPRAVLVGMKTHCRVHLQIHGTLESFVILFQPTGLHCLFSIPMYELTDQNFEAQSALGPMVSRLEQRLGECSTFEQRARVANDFFLRRALKVRSFDGIQAVAARILRGGGDSRISALADTAGLSIRQFERSFLQQVGMRPKLFARIARFEAALHSKARSAQKSWTDVAYEFGYHDQMHMVHDFEAFTGGTPTSVLKQFEILFREQIDAMRLRRLPEKSTSDSRLIL